MLAIMLMDAFLLLFLLSVCSGSDADLQRLKELNIGKVIIDVDAGADDALALLMAIEKQRAERNSVEIVAVTCLRGNTELPNVVVNVLKTLRVAKAKIPVYVGSNSSLMTNMQTDSFFGKDGFGESQFENPPKVSDATPGNAVIKMIDIVMKNPGKVTIICLGPLTNIAMAIRLNENFRNSVQQIVIMGGSIYGISNVRPFIEFNSYFDPEANFIVFNTTLDSMAPIILLPWDTCVKGVKLEKAWRVDVLGKAFSPNIKFINDIERISLAKVKTWSPADMLAMVSVLFPEVVTDAEMMYIDGVTQGELRGMLRADFSDKMKLHKNTLVIKRLDSNAVKEKVLTYLPGRRQ